MYVGGLKEGKNCSVPLMDSVVVGSETVHGPAVPVASMSTVPEAVNTVPLGSCGKGVQVTVAF